MYLDIRTPVYTASTPTGQAKTARRPPRPVHAASSPVTNFVGFFVFFLPKEKNHRCRRLLTIRARAKSRVTRDSTLRVGRAGAIALDGHT